LLGSIAAAEPALRPRIAAVLGDCDDPIAIQRRSLAELADLLVCRPDVARAADLLIDQLEGDGILELVEEMIQTSPGRAHHLVDELLLRTDLDPAFRGELARVAAPLALLEREPLAEPPHGRPRAITLRHPDDRTVVIVIRKDRSRTRLLCLLIDARDEIVEGLYRDDAGTVRAIEEELIAPLLADRFVTVPARAALVRSLVADAARRTVAGGGELPGAYFLGRDLLDLRDAHQPDGAWRPDVTATLLARGIELVAAGEVERARPLLERCVALCADDAEACASLGLCLFGNGEFDAARQHLERAAALEPGWPLHHWNLAALAHREGRLAACCAALRRFVTTSRALPRDAALAHDPEQATRIAHARAFVADQRRLRRIGVRAD
jgi:hypothetical protein